MAFGANAPHRPTQKVVWLIGFADGRRKVKDALYYSVFKEQAEAKTIATEGVDSRQKQKCFYSYTLGQY